jgi:serine/threonine protein kinase
MSAASQGSKRVSIVGSTTSSSRNTPATAWVLKPTEPIEKFYKLGQRLGQPGQFGQAVLAVHLKTGATRAVKIISKARFTRASDIKYHFEQLRAEIEVMQKMNHPNIIKLYEVFESPSDLYLVMECCSGGELFDRIKEQGVYTERDASAVLRQMCEGIKYMHENGVAHCFPQADTRVLTNRGFLYLEQIESYLSSSSSLFFAIYDRSSCSLSYSPGRLVKLAHQPENLIKFSIPSKSSTNSPLTLRSTGNHQVLVRYDGSEEWTKSRADALLSSPHSFQFLTHVKHGIYPGNQENSICSRLLLSSESFSALLEFYGIWLFCGLSSPDSVKIQVKTQAAIDLLSHILPQLALSKGDYTSELDENGLTVDIFSSSWLSEFSDRSLVASWVLHSLNSSQSRLVIDSYLLASGESECIHTCSASLRDSLLVLLFHAGFAAHFDCEANSSSFTLRWSDNPENHLVNPVLNSNSCVSAEPYNAKIDGSLWCINVDHPDHLIVAQRAVRNASGDVAHAGQPIIIGNCDLKPDNFLFFSPLPSSPLKIIDFGMSKFIDRRKGRYFQVICGTPYVSDSIPNSALLLALTKAKTIVMD